MRRTGFNYKLMALAVLAILLPGCAADDASLPSTDGSVAFHLATRSGDEGSTLRAIGEEQATRLFVAERAQEHVGLGDDEALHLARTVDLTGGSYQLADLYGQWYKFAFVCVPDIAGQDQLGFSLFNPDNVSNQHDFNDYYINYSPVLTYQTKNLREAQGKDLAIYRKVIDRWVDAVNPTSEDVVLGRQTGELVLDMGKLKDQFEQPVTRIDLVLTDVVDRMFVRDEAVDSVIVNTDPTNDYTFDYTFSYPVYEDDDPDQRVVISYALLPGQLTSAKVQVTYTIDGTTTGTTEITLADEDATPITIRKNVRTTVLFNGLHPDEFEVRYAGFDDGNDAVIDVSGGDKDEWNGVN